MMSGISICLQSSKPYLIMWCQSRYWNDEVCKIYITVQLDRSKIMTEVKVRCSHCNVNTSRAAVIYSKYFVLSDHSTWSLKIRINISAIVINQTGFSFTRTIDADTLITGHLCCCPEPCQCTFGAHSWQMSSNHAEHMLLCASSKADDYNHID